MAGWIQAMEFLGTVALPAASAIDRRPAFENGRVSRK
jgi:hypothetical protein